MSRIFYILVFLFISIHSIAQYDRLNFNAEGQVYANATDRVPFWMRANQFGSVPVVGSSLSILGQASVHYDTSKIKLIDWGMGVQARANVGKTSNLIIIESYAKVRIGIFEFKGGRSKDIMGISDTTLSSGNFAVSGNALGIPKIQISIPEYYSLPVLGKILSLKGNLAHGWVGQQHVQFAAHSEFYATQFHQKSLYLRFGKPDWKLKLHGGFNHQAFFGHENEMWEQAISRGQLQALSGFQTYEHVFFGKVWNRSKVGNHLGSIDLALEYNINGWNLLAYRQTFYDIGGLAYLSNIADGLHGLSISRKAAGTNRIYLGRALVEFLYTKNQGGELWSKQTPSGDEDYYNNDIYAKGWSYKNKGLGTPFISTKDEVRHGLPHYPADYFINNRVIAFHFGAELVIGKWQLLPKLSFSKNQGTFGTSLVGHTAGSGAGKVRTSPDYGIFPDLHQFSGFLQAERTLNGKIRVGVTVASDHGRLLNNSTGAMVKFAKAF